MDKTLFREKRVAGGIVATPNSFPWLALIKIDLPDTNTNPPKPNFYCTGTIVSEIYLCGTCRIWTYWKSLNSEFILGVIL